MKKKKTKTTKRLPLRLDAQDNKNITEIKKLTGINTHSKAIREALGQFPILTNNLQKAEDHIDKLDIQLTEVKEDIDNFMFIFRKYLKTSK